MHFSTRYLLALISVICLLIVLIMPLMDLSVSRMVCVALISSDNLEWERTQLWALTFKLIRKIIGGVDYKVFDCIFFSVDSLFFSSGITKFGNASFFLVCKSSTTTPVFI